MAPKNTAPGAPANKPSPSTRPKKDNNLLHYAAYFIVVGSLVFVAQTDKPRQAESAAIGGAIASICVISRDWYKARLDPNMANDPTALINLFSEMLHAGRDQTNTNSAHMKRVEFLQVDLVDAMRGFNDMLRLDPAEVEQRLRALQSANLTDALSAVSVPPVPPGAPGGHAINSSIEFSSPKASTTHVPQGTTVQQSANMRRPGFDA